MDLDNTYRTTKDYRHLNAFYQSHLMIFITTVLEADSNIMHMHIQSLPYVKLRVFVITKYLKKHSRKNFRKIRKYLGFFPTIFEDYRTDATSPKNSKLLKKNIWKIKIKHIVIRNYKYTDYSYNFT